MKNFLQTLAAVMLLAVMLTGCLTSIIPKPVEFGQKKVQPVPVKSLAQQETERQAVQVVEAKVETALENAKDEAASGFVTAPLEEADAVTEALGRSMGPPEDPWKGSIQKLIERLDRQEARLNQKIEAYRREVREVEGKKIEGTGWLQMPYLVFVGLILLGLFAVSVLWKVFSVVGPALNPAIGIGTGVVNMSAQAAAKGFKQLVAGGEKFKEAVQRLDLPEKTAAQIVELFRMAHESRQDEDVQNAIRAMTPKK